MLALAIDWTLSYGLTALGLAAGVVTRGSLPTALLVVWLSLGVVALRLFGFTPGQLACGLRVAPIDQPVEQPAAIGLGRALMRGALVALAIPPLFTDADGRGLQDRATGTAVVRR